MEAAAGFISAEKEVGSAQEALAGACDILAEQLADDAHCREYIRERIMKEGRIVSEGREENMDKTYEMYFAYDELIQKTADHRILALNRGEKEKDCVTPTPERVFIGTFCAFERTFICIN